MSRIGFVFTLLVAQWDLSTTGEAVSLAALVGDTGALEEARDALATALEDVDDRDQPERRYLLAYTHWRLSDPNERGSKQSESHLEDAEKQLEKLLEAHPTHAEGLALYGSVNGGLIGGMFSGMRRGPRADKAFKKARELAPESPRVAMQQGVSRLFRPGAFGGGVDKAEAELIEALELYEREPPDAPWPNWGRAEIYAWLGVTMARKEDLPRAREYYERALSVEPGYRWVRDVLLPALDELEADLTKRN